MLVYLSAPTSLGSPTPSWQARGTLFPWPSTTVSSSLPASFSVAVQASSIHLPATGLPGSLPWELSSLAWLILPLRIRISWLRQFTWAPQKKSRDSSL